VPAQHAFTSPVRAIASICCSPPGIGGAFLLAPFLSLGKQLMDQSAEGPLGQDFASAKIQASDIAVVFIRYCLPRSLH